MNSKNQLPLPTLIVLILVPLLILGLVIFFQQRSEKTIFTNQLAPIALNDQGLETLIAEAGQAQYVLLGESSHGTADYYNWRREISKKLIQDHGFSFIAVEGDWASMYKVNQYVKGLSTEFSNGREILDSFERWPKWMWANEEFLELVEWLYNYNQTLPLEQRVGVYGKDLYGINDSMQEVLAYLEEFAGEEYQQALSAYQCLQQYDDDFQAYIMDFVNQTVNCQEGLEAVVAMLRDNGRNFNLVGENGSAYFNLKQNALVVQNGEAYYRHSAVQGPGGWNSRVEHMKQTVNRLTDYYQKKTDQPAKGIVWAHNTHVGDARATEMASAGMVNIGQLLRQKLGDDQVFIVGFGTNQGTVLAGREWGSEMQILQVPPARTGSIEQLLSQLQQEDFILLFDQLDLPEELAEARGHRAKGVVYNPEREAGNYVTTLLPSRYNAFIFINETQALNPL